MKNLEKNIKILALKVSAITKYTVVKCKEYTQKAKVAAVEFGQEKELSLPHIHFNFHHLVSVTLVALMAFFITFYTTKFNTKAVDAYSEEVQEVQTDVINKQAVAVNYGDLEVVAAQAKEILNEEVSSVKQLKTISSTPDTGVYELDDYMINVKLAQPELGEQVATLTIEAKEDVNKADDNKLNVVSSVDNDFTKGTKTTYQVAVDVIDTIAPTITMSSDDTTIEASDEFDVKQYISSITDNFNGAMTDFTVEGEVAKDGDDYKAGKYTLTIRAKDTSGNESAAQLIVRVKEKVKVQLQEKTQNNVQFGSYGESAYAGSVVAEARAQVGKAYVFGAAGPNAFDCSGLVQYVYARSGISIPRTSGGQASVGVAINPNDVSQWRAGDIVTFGPGGSAHAAIYSGHGTYIHALNPSQGIQETGMHGYFGTVYAVRRVQ